MAAWPLRSGQPCPESCRQSAGGAGAAGAPADPAVAAAAVAPAAGWAACLVGLGRQLRRRQPAGIPDRGGHGGGYRHEPVVIRPASALGVPPESCPAALQRTVLGASG